MRIVNWAAGILAVAMLASCSEETNTPQPPEDEEVITTVRLTLTDRDGSGTQVFVWQDSDGPGGAGPDRIDTIQLQQDHQYDGTVEFLDVSGVGGVVDVTPAIRNEADHHQVFTSFSQDKIVATIKDTDSRNLPLGLQFLWVVAEVATTKEAGTVTVALSHFDNAADKNGTTPSDETDVSVTFPMVIR